MLSQSDTFEALQRPINKIQLIIHDPLLSQFKYHFIIKRLPIMNFINDNFRWKQLLQNLYKGFKAYFMGHNSINIVQISAQYPQNGEVDLIVGLRRDQHALKFYRQIHQFEYGVNKYQVEVAEGFKTYLDQLNDKYRKEAEEHQRIKSSQNISQIKNKQILDIQKQAKTQNILIQQSGTQYENESNANIKSQKNEEPFQLILTQKKSNKKRNSSQSSRNYSNSSYSQQNQRQSIKNKEGSSQQSRQKYRNQKYNNQYRNSQYQKKSYYRRNNSSKDSKHSRSSDYSRSNSKNKYSYYKSRGVSKNQRSRQKNYYNRKPSSQRQNSKSRQENMKNKYHTKRSSSQQRRNYGYRQQKDRRYEQNRKYEIYPPYNRTFSNTNHNERLREPPLQLNKKYIRPNAARYQPNPYIDYNKQSHSSGYNYYKNMENYAYIKPVSVVHFDQKSNLPPSSSISKIADPNNLYRNLPKGSYYQKNEGYNQ